VSPAEAIAKQYSYFLKIKQYIIVFILIQPEINDDIFYIYNE